ncbi:MAG: helix-turn-helix transcriptional regulator [Clostridia bacterium]|nr:helix-turn-helix transcriptional regulator [Clostridia bacterium]
MENNLIIEQIYKSYEGEFNPAFIKRNEPRNCDGFCYVLKGSADYIFNKTTISVAEGDVLFLPKGGEYNILVKESAKYLCIDFSFNKKGLMPCSFKNMRHVKNDFYKFLYNWLNPSLLRTPKSYELINRIYCELITAKNKNYSNSYAIFSKAMDLIVKNYQCQDFTVESLAKEVGISTVHLRRVFLNCADASPKKIINDIRFEQAKLLLTTSNLSINEIALNVGFCDQFHFSKSFKEAVGLSPTDYKKHI